MKKVRLNVPQISCNHCVNTIKRELSQLPGVSMVSGDPTKKEIEVEFGPPAELSKIKELLKEIGYPGTEV